VGILSILARGAFLISVGGLGNSTGTRTKVYLLSRELEHVTRARTVGEVVDAVEEAYLNLRKLGLYDGVQILIDEGNPVRFLLALN
jgi:hypothetical protein